MTIAIEVRQTNMIIGVRQTNKAENLHSDSLGIEASSLWLLKQDSART